MLVTINYTQNALEHFPDTLQPTFQDGILLRETSLSEIRALLHP